MKKLTGVLGVILTAWLNTAPAATPKLGSLDPTFGKKGVATTDTSWGTSPGSDDYYIDSALQSDGKLVTLARSNALDENEQWQPSDADDAFLLIRHTENGKLDPTFGKGGIAIVNVRQLCPQFIGDENFWFSIASLALQSDGKMIVAGTIFGNDYDADGTLRGDFLLMRVNANGAPDLTFGNQGVVIQNCGSEDYLSQVFVLKSGKILAFGDNYLYDAATDTYPGYTVQVRLNANGALDSTFGKGKPVLNLQLGDFYFGGLVATLQPDEKLLFAEAVRNSDDYPDADIHLQRFNTDGSLDKAFGAQGTTIIPIAGTSDNPVQLAVQNDGKIVLSSYTQTSPDYRFDKMILFRFTGQGKLDPTFGSGGITYEDYASFPVSYGMTLQSDGKILVIARPTYFDVYNDYEDPTHYLLRYDSKGNLDYTYFQYTDYYGYLFPTPLTLSDVTYIAKVFPVKNGNLLVAGLSSYYSYGSDDDYTADYNLQAARYIGTDTYQPDISVGVNPGPLIGDKIINSTGAGQTVSLRLNATVGKQISIIVKNTGNTYDSLLLQGPTGDANFAISYVTDGYEVTNEVTKGGYVTKPLAPGGSYKIIANVVVKTAVAQKTRDFTLTTRSSTTTAKLDVATIKMTSNGPNK